MREKGFTLAEVLVTLVVIGAIAAMTIPAIIQSTQNAELKAAFKSNYSMIDQATKILLIDNAGSLAGVFTGGDDNFRDKYSQYLNYVKTCDESSVSHSTDAGGNYILSNCWSKYNYYLNRSKGTDAWAYDSQAILNNGAFIDFWLSSTTCSGTHISTGNDCGLIIIDVNGPKGPNQYGRDIFSVWVAKNGLVPFGSQTDSWSNTYGECDPNASGPNGSGHGCAAYVLQNKDY